MNDEVHESDSATKINDRHTVSLRRVGAIALAIVVVGGASVAVAAVGGGGGEPPATYDPETGSYEPNYPKAGDSLGYIDLQTGDPIRCPDGHLLVYEPPPGNVATPGYPLEPRCADGSQPDLYKQQMADFEKFLNSGPGGQDVADGPNFSVSLSKLENAGVPYRVK